MTADNIGIYIPDPTYGHDNDIDVWESKSESFRSGLETQYGLRFSSTNIGPGADVPAFVTWLSLQAWPYLALAILLFFQGKRTSENLEAWIDLYGGLRNFFAQKPVFDRDGAAILAVNEIISRLGKSPASIRLIGYRVVTFADETDPRRIEPPSNIEDPVPTHFLGFIVHVFRVEADDRIFQVIVNGSTVELLEDDRS